MIKLEGSQQLHGHKFVLAARSDNWGVSDLSTVSSLDFSGICFAWSYQRHLDKDGDGDV